MKHFDKIICRQIIYMYWDDNAIFLIVFIFKLASNLLHELDNY